MSTATSIDSVDSLTSTNGAAAKGNGDLFIGSLTGNVFRWYPGWSTGLRENEPGVAAPR